MACACGKKAESGVRRAAARSSELSGSIKTQVSAAQRVRERQAAKAAAAESATVNRASRT